MVDRIAFVTYETPFAPCGGIAAVMGYLPPAVQEHSKVPTIGITPFHYHLPKTAQLASKMELIGSVCVDYGNITVSVNVLKYKDQIDWYFLLPDDPQFFAGKRHPYDLNTAGESSGSQLFRDALLFGVASAKAIHLIAPGQQFAIFMQDWEAATTALAVAQQQADHELFLTMHNSYDCTAPTLDLLAFHLNPEICPGHSILERACQVVNAPLTTVSKQFAVDLTTDVLHSKVFAPHLQHFFHTKKIAGIDNGPFLKLAVPKKVVKQSLDGKLDVLKEWKTSRRVDFGDALRNVQACIQNGTTLPWETEDHPWGDLDSFLSDFDPNETIPWFVLGGRDDPRQKGYDVAVKAAQGLLESDQDARFIFFPIPGDEGFKGLQFLKDFSEKEAFRKRVLVFPFRFREGYMSALQGATFGLMPSFYEPFGAANEFYLNGTLGIGRATGGIVQQIVPWRDCNSFNLAIAKRANLYHDASATPTGLLFREVENLPSEIADWEGINRAGYNRASEIRDRVRERTQFPLFEAMSNSLRLALEDGIKLFQQQEELYYQMLVAGIQHTQASISWERAAKEYTDVINQPRK